MIIEDFGHEANAEQALATRWRMTTDGVMGGISHGRVSVETVDAAPALVMQGTVRLENNGGFIQAVRLVTAEEAEALAGFDGLEIDVFGNGTDYGCHLRTTALDRPWQSFRHGFDAPSRWTRVRLPFARFQPHRTQATLEAGAIRKIGLAAIGRAFNAWLACGRIAAYKL